ncbi:MAG: BON domain-containing protein [Anaerolineae bacterium]
MPTHDYRIGASVVCSDGRCGRLFRLVVNPQTREITDIVVEKGFVLTRDTVVPVDLVESADKDEVRLSISGDQLQELAEYTEVNYETLLADFPQTPEERAEAEQRPAPEGAGRPTPGGAFYATPVAARVGYHVPEGVERGKVVISHGTTVMGAGDEIGTVDHVLVDPESDAIAYLVVDQGPLGDTLVVPAEMIAGVSSDAVCLDAGGDALSRLPRYQPREPSQILADIHTRLASSGADTQHVHVQMEEGVVSLTGTVPSRADMERIVEAARGTPGVIDLENELALLERQREE